MSTSRNRFFTDKKYRTLRSSQKALLSTAYNMFNSQEYRSSLNIYLQLLIPKNLTPETRAEIKEQINTIMSILKKTPKSSKLSNLLDHPDFEEDEHGAIPDHSDPDKTAEPFVESMDYSMDLLKKSFKLFLKTQSTAKDLSNEEDNFDESTLTDLLKLPDDFPLEKSPQNIPLEQFFEDSTETDPQPPPHTNEQKPHALEYPFQEVLAKLQDMKNLKSELFEKQIDFNDFQKLQLFKQSLERSQLPILENQFLQEASLKKDDSPDDFISLDEHLFEELEDQAIQNLQDQAIPQAPKASFSAHPQDSDIDHSFFPNVHPADHSADEALEDSFEKFDTEPPPASSQEPQPRRLPPPQEPKKPIPLTYNFKNLFKSRFYKKYRSMLNEAASLVAKRELDDALELYYVVKSQNIPSSFKKMIQKNIEDIESAITHTFLLSDTIVQVDDRGKIHNVQVDEEE